MYIFYIYVYVYHIMSLDQQNIIIYYYITFSGETKYSIPSIVMKILFLYNNHRL